MPRRVRPTGLKGRRSSAGLTKTSGYAPSRFLVKPRNYKIKFEIEGYDKLKYNIDKVIRNSKSSTYDAIKQSSLLVVKETKRILIRGEYRAYSSGTLYKSVRFIVEEHARDLIYSAIGVFDVHYAVYVHEGTRNMEARPFLKLAFERKKALIEKLIKNAIQNDLKKGII